MRGRCEDCKMETACKKVVGLMFGFCKTDFEPKTEEQKNDVQRAAECVFLTATLAGYVDF